ncbi:MAG: hypothetical protein E7255_10990 [Lachnospiraceae bacterium]|nr:hypothetical protein [Lachnospiraceae bacterium]
MEHKETRDLIDRVCSDPVGSFTGGFDTILSAASLMISSISLLIIIMTSTIISGILIIADRILVLKDGRIVENGTHKELITRNGRI